MDVGVQREIMGMHNRELEDPKSRWSRITELTAGGDKCLETTETTKLRAGI